MSLNKLKWAAIIRFVVSILVFLGGGYFAKDRVPPYPGKVVDPEGRTLFRKTDIKGGSYFLPLLLSVSSKVISPLPLDLPARPVV
ncbi:MAG: hypothetical protein A2156_04380 [Deltaproteobacteria bacterium RBG_16_48_10]|nr:MAG: hypothetical protein A2156_04380 [Deltaproteobacteria bacterium RBG_16_48_10]